MRATFTLALLLAVAWADHHEHHEHHDHHDHHGSHQHQGDEMMCHHLSPPNADFAFALYKNINSKTAAGKNIFFSPLGVSTALSMLSTGARGETHSQMFSTLGYSSMNQSSVDDAYDHLFHMLGHSQQSQVLNVGNGLALRTSFSPLGSFIADIKKHYSAEIFKVDFEKPLEAAAEINKFISDKTQEKIKDMVKDLDSAMAMVLINYVYFRGQWEKPFDANHTSKAEFFVNDKTKVEVDMMKRTGRYDFYQDMDNHTSVILLPYKGNTSMMIVLPDEGKMKEVEDVICKDHLKHWHDSVYRNSVDLFLPKFSVSGDASLDESLKELGMTDAFGDKADFAGISEEIKLKVSKASHQAVLSVDETGTEAAAATTIEVMPMSMPERMILNRPFLVFILEHSTKSILFMGKISNPTEA
ncbi:alpha-1-antitrypsin homolog [Eucyclogobius newberryi]|uniref:alpha-1-antitrypsin homolog n=1 Tax=Eucyclogobius newberryi TaxID=166745 RepID=UPI003B5CEC09